MRRWFFGLSLALGTLATDGLAQGPSVTAAITKAVSCFEVSLNRHDMPAFGQCFAPGAEFVNVIGTWWKGRDAIERNHAFLYGTIAQSDTAGITTPLRNYGIVKTTVLTFTSVDVRLINEQVAVAHGAWRVVGDARTNEPRNGLMTLVLMNQGGRWLIEAVHNGEVARSVQ
jgi:hypothetical protein